MLISVDAQQQWALDGRYVEHVWSEFLGPTATLLARRLGDLLERQPHGGELSLTQTGASLGPRRLAPLCNASTATEIVTVSQTATVSVTGLAPSVGFERLHRLSEPALLEHRRQLAAATDPPASVNGRQPGSASWVRRSAGRSL